MLRRRQLHGIGFLSSVGIRHRLPGDALTSGDHSGATVLTNPGWQGGNRTMLPSS